MATWIKDKAPLKSGEYFVYLKHENDAPDDKPTRDSVEYIEKEGWHIGSGWAIVKWLDESESTPTTTVGGSAHQLAVKILNDLNDKGAKLGNASILIIEDVLAAHAQQSPSVDIGETLAIKFAAWNSYCSLKEEDIPAEWETKTKILFEQWKKTEHYKQLKIQPTFFTVDIVEALDKSNPYRLTDGKKSDSWNEAVAKLRELIASQPPAPLVQGLDETLSLLNYIYGEAIGGKPLRADTMNRINQLTWKIRKCYQTPSNTEGQEEQQQLFIEVIKNVRQLDKEIMSIYDASANLAHSYTLIKK